MTTTRRGGLAIELSTGHRFIRQKLAGKKWRWLCVKQKWLKCKAFLCTVDNVIVKMSDDHTHD
ncbi:hypothetical protein JYU34_004389 [Plutella xylostella]|uniref:FLYWCH-type domain-containing protein n=1 Tax=Plutella xylostella TaxID=51655 RepID=A0ABQ7QXU6_PLUXY|nr:hypothetical protein JYU34_004389 [Plutella xylostella]